jgi:16S rRNA (cytosine1402-N4)-methyltransferase
VNQAYHIPVLAKEAIELLNIRPDTLIVDATLGGGGHSEQILINSPQSVKLIAIDQDQDALDKAKEVLSKYLGRVEFVKDNFGNIKNILNGRKMDGILFDLGVSSYQIDTPGRGFSFQDEGELDMRMDRTKGRTAKDIVNNLSEDEIADIIWQFGEERNSRKIARSIVNVGPINTTKELSNAIMFASRGAPPLERKKALARVFQAIRIAVNDEMTVLKKAINDSIELLKPKGRIVVMSYHSLEDKIIKANFKLEATDCICPPKLPVCMCGHKKKLELITKKPISATDDEITINPRARSAKLRVAEKI